MTERKRAGIAHEKQRGAYKGRTKTLIPERFAEVFTTATLTAAATITTVMTTRSAGVCRRWPPSAAPHWIVTNHDQ